MTKEEQAQKIEEIYNDAMEKLARLSARRKEVIGQYIKELEVQKISAIRASVEGNY